MKIKILFNSTSICNDCSVGWGLSILINNKILFDTGEKGDFILNNIKQLDVDLLKIEKIVISHDHWDHTGGLWDILRNRSKITVYGCAGFSNKFKDQIRAANSVLVESHSFKKISENIYTTGEIQGLYKGSNISEQSIVIDTDKGLVVITGCAHPGILEILDIVCKRFPDKKLYAVLGGFHLINKPVRNINALMDCFRKLNIKKVGSTHCSGEEAKNIFKKAYANDFIEMKVGEEIVL